MSGSLDSLPLFHHTGTDSVKSLNPSVLQLPLPEKYPGLAQLLVHMRSENGSALFSPAEHKLQLCISLEAHRGIPGMLCTALSSIGA